jgi:rod shape determining protein RodA
MAQPDLGSAALLIVTWLGLVFLLSFKRKYIIGLLVILLAISFISWSFILADYQKDRISTFINPQSDPLGSGYNVRQSIIAIGAGELWGRGIAQGTQSQLRFLPESHTDFIFAVIGEELGFVGVIAVITAWLFIFIRMYSLGTRTRDNFSSIALAGFVIIIGSQVIVNIGMNVGLLPVTGLGLPFVSYGRSSLLATFIAFGIIMNIGRSVRKGEHRLF